jgi:hypothetical protein
MVSEDDGRPRGPIRDHLEEKLRADVGQGHVSTFDDQQRFEISWFSFTACSANDTKSAATVGCRSALQYC